MQEEGTHAANRKLAMARWAVADDGLIVHVSKKLSDALKYRQEHGGVLLSVNERLKDNES